MTAYMFDAGGRYAMCITITDKSAPLDVAFADAKAKADDLFNRAMAAGLARAPEGGPPPPQPTVQIDASH